MLTEKKTTVDRIRVVLQKGYVLYGLNLTSELVYRFLQRVDRKRKLIIDRMEDWPKNRTILFIQNVHFYQNHFFHSVNPPLGQLEVYVFGQHAVKNDTQAPKSDLIHTKRTPFVKPRGFGQPSFFFGQHAFWSIRGLPNKFGRVENEK